MAKTPLLTKQEDFTAEQPNFAKVGDVVSAMLTEVQFQALRDSTWVLMDGRDVTGSEYDNVTGNTTLPDARGQFIRGKNNGRSDGQENPDGDVALGAAQVDEMGSHHHTTNINGGTNANAGANPQQFHSTSSYWNTSPMVSDTKGGNETRPKNVTINYFIKIN